MNFKPMLAETIKDVGADVIFPCYASPKLDGLRGVVRDGKLLSRSLKPFPNKATYEHFSSPMYEGLDGELVVGSPTAPDCFIRSTSGLRNREGDPEATFYVFELTVGVEGTTFRERLELLSELWAGTFAEHRIVVLEQVLINTVDELDAYESKCLADGFEGVIVRHPDSPYKMGRSTLQQGFMLKLKRFQDSEGELLGMVEGLHNANEAVINELGYLERSTDKSNMIGTDTMGALVLRDLKTGVLFTVGTGFDIKPTGKNNPTKTRSFWWDQRSGETVPLNTIIKGVSPSTIMHLPNMAGRIIKYSHFAIGYGDVPRFPVFAGERIEEDMSA